MADLNRELAEGTASNALIMLAPLLWPASVIVVVPPKADATFFTNFIAFMMSLTARFVLPSGAMKPSYTKGQFSGSFHNAAGRGEEENLQLPVDIEQQLRWNRWQQPNENHQELDPRQTLE